MESRGRNVSGVAVVGRACRLPGAPSVSALWNLLNSGHCAVTEIPADRWSLSRFGHPRRGEPGRSYTWAAGVLDDIWGFDAAAFGISPREAEQMDPQQRLLLELVREALEDAGIPAASLAGKDVGVFVGASALDHGNSKLFDIAASDAYFATGNTLSLISNRISYIYDLHGPSLTIDTACSSSLVALHQAVSAIKSGQIKTAIVAGVNILASPFSFIGFSRASMLSPTGRCHTFDERADGYVRAEGGVVLVLRALPEALAARNELHGLVLATGSNSDGRTMGVALPSATAQANLLTRIYGENHLDPDDIAFIEAHGTGTRVGDPAEARAIGESLGVRRTRPLPIGSIKTNVGHLEPASGLAGVLKSLLALEHNILPPSLHCEQPNREIPFETLNIAVAVQSSPLAPDRDRLAGINSFGFGGTNAHAVVARAPVRVPDRDVVDERRDRIMLLSAHSSEAVLQMAERAADDIAVADAAQTRRIVAALGHRRDRLSSRIAILPADRTEIDIALRDVARGVGDIHPLVVAGQAVAANASTAFVYSGNGSQWSGMGRVAFLTNDNFREAFREVDQIFAPLADWRLEQMLFAHDLEQQLALTKIAQPLIFALQYATTQVLGQLGLHPDMVLGHSVGEIAAAQAAGILPLESAVRVVHSRSIHQERARLAGRMVVVFAEPDRLQALLATHPAIELAALNGPRAFTVSGPENGLDLMVRDAGAQGIKTHRLDLDYPFHCNAMDVVREPLLADLADLQLDDAVVRFISTVSSAEQIPTLDGAYWWRNVRDPVLFSSGIERAEKFGAQIFVEIGPRPTLLRHIVDSVASAGTRIATIATLDRTQDDDPFPVILASALVRGARISADDVGGFDPGPGVGLPSYPWQRKTFRLGDTPEALSVLNPTQDHPLIGARLSHDATEWRQHIDTLKLADFSDHVVHGTALLPGAAFVEMMWAAARDWHGSNQASIVDLELLLPMQLDDAATREVRTTVAPSCGVIEISSRARLSDGSWLLHAKGKMIQPTGSGPVLPAIQGSAEVFDADDIYQKAADAGLTFGPAFRLADTVRKFSTSRLSVALKPDANPIEYGVAPPRLDACFHGLIVLFDNDDGQTPYVPIRFGECRLQLPGRAPASAEIAVKVFDQTRIIADFNLYDGSDALVAVLRDVRFQAKRDEVNRTVAQTWRQILLPVPALNDDAAPIFANTAFEDIFLELELSAHGSSAMAMLAPDTALLEGYATTTAYEIAHRLGSGSSIDVPALLKSGRVGARSAEWLTRLLNILVASGLATPNGTGFDLTPDPTLPSAQDVFAAFAQEFPETSAELLAAGELMQFAISLREMSTALERPSLHALTTDALRDHGMASRRASIAVETMLRNVLRKCPPHQSPRILLIGYGPLFAATSQLARQSNAFLTLVDENPTLLERARLASVPSPAAITFATSLNELRNDVFDLVLFAGRLHQLAELRLTLHLLHQYVAPGGLLMGADPLPGLFAHMTQTPDVTDDTELCISLLPSRSDAEWQRTLAEFEARDIRQMSVAGDGIRVLVARNHETATARTPEPRTIIIVQQGEDLLAQHLAQDMISRGHRAVIASPGEAACAGTCDDVVYLRNSGNDSLLDRLTQRILDFKTLVGHRTRVRGSLHVITRSAFARHEDADVTESGFWAFLRTVRNEYPELVVFAADIPAHSDAHIAASSIANRICSGSIETELVLDADRTRAVRIVPAQQPGRGNKTADSATLVRGAGGLDRLTWTPSTRSTPGGDEVEIEIKASGLNFRDLMSAMSLLPDSILEHGFAGATLGLECSGLVTRVGSNVKNVETGQRVIALARNGFANHVVVPASGIRAIPDDLPFEAAASIPVAFSTAYYALVTLADIRRDEWILIHGGAGGVGLAALQVAKSRGAKVIASAGSKPKRDLLLSLGADHVVDSRAMSFSDAVRAIVPEGVHVVLNSVTEEAMERSIMLLRPFGRFIELGKRDYIANTHIGLAPFRRNLSYHGVDLDQLVIHRPDVFARVLDAVIAGMASGELTPIPYRIFPASGVGDAFRAMQQSVHVGKLILTPPDIVARSEPATTTTIDYTGTYLVSGGLGGFGLKTALWLAKQGVRHLVLVGRNTPGDDARGVIGRLGDIDVSVKVAACDISDEAKVAELLSDIRSQMPPLRGVLHAAMVLEDGVLTSLDEAGLRRVLRPKLLGAEILDRLTRQDELSCFVLFSSATTFVGNPGQSAYVAANASIESLARNRRRAGQCALAVAWGAIDDVGVLADNGTLRQSLGDRLGVRALRSDDALAALGRALEYQSNDPDAAALAIAPIDWTAASARLAVLSSPTFSAVVAGDRKVDAGRDDTIDIHALLTSAGRDAALAATQKTVVEVLSRVLRIPAAEIDMHRPLVEMGIDSLMAIELAMMIEARLGEKIQLTASVGAISVSRLAGQIVDRLATPTHNLDLDVGSAMLARHFDSIGEDDHAKLTQAVIQSNSAPKDRAISPGLG